MNENNQNTIALRQYLTGIIGNSPYGIVTISNDQEVSIINSYAVTLLGFDNEDPHKFIDIDYHSVFANIPELLDGLEQQIMTRYKRKLNLDNLFSGKYILNIKCRVMLHGILIVIENKTRQAELEEELRYQATHDALTKLVNRTQYEDRLKKYIEKTKIHDLIGAVLFIDIDRFKPVNDTAGHAAGDLLLTNIANILVKNIRDRDTLARIGGDEFAVLFESCPLEQAEKIAETIRQEVEDYVFIYDNNIFKLSLSIGIAIIDATTDNLSSVINAADNACQIAKNEGHNRVHVSYPDKAEYQDHIKTIAWLPKIHKALSADSFILYAQKISGIEDGVELPHYELLIRLLNEDGSIIPPDVFIPPAERYDMMPKIDYWVIKQAFKAFNDQFIYSINLSGQTVSDENLASYIEKLQQTYHVKAEQIIFEITETAVIQNMEKTRTFIKRLKLKGFRFSLDDFGSGLSSFAYLKNIPVDYLKIDGSFVKEIGTDKVSNMMVKSINDVAHSMGLKTVAEFVKDNKILSKLKEIGVDYAQGYHIHKPQPLAKIIPM